MTQGVDDGRKQFTSKVPITQERTVMSFKNGRWGSRVVQEQIEFRYDSVMTRLVGPSS